MMRLPRAVRRLLICGFSAAALVLLLLWYSVHQVNACEKFVYRDVQTIPAREYGLLLGTIKMLPNGLLNEYFVYRIDAAAALYHAGKIKKIIVSGDNGRKTYNEPQTMKESLLEAGVREEDILPDYAGFRTLDSVLRSHALFHISDFTVISQDFHCRRAIFIAQGNQLNAIGFAAKGVSPRFRIKTFFREPLACLLAWCDVKIFRRKPHFPS